MRLTDEQLIQREKYNELIGIMINTPYVKGRIRFRDLQKWLVDIDFPAKKPVFNGKYPKSELRNHLFVLEERDLIKRKNDKTKGKPYYEITTKGNFIYLKKELQREFGVLLNELQEKDIEALYDIEKVIFELYKQTIEQKKKK